MTERLSQLLGYDLDRLHVSEAGVQAMDGQQRLVRMHDLFQESHNLLDIGIKKMIVEENRVLAGICILFSGGNDSTCLTHMFRERADCAVHANTTIGIEQTRRFVRQTCADWGLELREYLPPPGSQYRDLVLEHGFPGPAMHWKMYQRLKERCLRQAQREFVKNQMRERVVFLAGRRRTESQRRASVPEFDKEGSIVWISPLINWTKTDLHTYRAWAGDVPKNEVPDLVHMSGECLCGAFAKKNELAEIGMFFPGVVSQIRRLEKEVAATGRHPEKICKWGWGAESKLTKDDLMTGPLCSSCEYRNEDDDNKTI